MGTYIGGNLQALVKQLDFSFSDGTRGTAFIVTSIGSMIPEVESMVVDSVLVLGHHSGFHQPDSDSLDL